MAIKFIDDDFFRLRDFNRDEIDILRLDKDFRLYYYRIYSLYTELFIKYLIKNTKIKEYDELLTDSNLNFKQIESDQKDFYQEYCSYYLNYFYIRNNLHLYRLTDKQKDFLNTKLVNEDYNLDEDAERLIENTFQLIIFDVVDNDFNKIVNINYGPIFSGIFAPNNALVIGLRLDDTKDNLNLKEDEWFQNKIKQRELINQLCTQLAGDIKEKLNCNCSIIEFNDFTVKKKINELDENSNLGL